MSRFNSKSIMGNDTPAQESREERLIRQKYEQMIRQEEKEQKKRERKQMLTTNLASLPLGFNFQ